MPVTNQWTSKTICAVLLVTMAVGVLTLSGPNVCMVQQKYNITKRVKYRAPMSIRTYEWCFSMPPRCSKWSTEMRDLTRLETEERTAEVAVCCPGYKMKDVSCVAICPNGKTGHGCTKDCPPNKWGPNCVNKCGECINGYCLPTTGECDCEDGWQGESCKVSMPTTQPPPALMEELLTTTKSSIRTVPSTLSTIPTVKTKSFMSPIHTLTSTTTSITTFPTKMTLSTTKKTETTSKLSTLFTKTTSVPLYNNISLTYITPMWAETNTTIELPKITKANYIYNRTETPVEGTSVKLISKHDRSPQMKIPITVKPQKIPFRLNSTVSPYVTESTVFLSTTMPRSSIITLFSSTTTTPNTTSNTTTISMTTTTNSYVNTSFPIPTTTAIPPTTLPTTSTTPFPEAPSTSFTIPFKIPSTTPITIPFTKPITTPPTVSSTPNTTTIVSRSTIHDNTTLSTFLLPNINIPIVTTNQKPIITYISTTAPPTTNLTTPSVIPTNLSTSMAKLTINMDKEVTEKDMTVEYTRKPEILNYNLSTTVKFKPKEIWIKPTQKGESTFESKFKNIHDVHNKHKTVTNKNEAVSENTTPKTIIVSIIPTSVSHATFKKIALTTASYVYQKKNVTLKLPSRIDKGFTKSMTSQVSTAMPFTIKILPTLKAKTLGTSKSTTQLSQDTTRMFTPTSKKALLHTTVPEKQTSKVLNTTIATSRTTNSMSTLNEVKNLTSPILTIKPRTNKDKPITRTSEITTISNKKIQPPLVKDEASNKTIKVNITRSKAKLQETAIKILTEKANSKNITKISNKVTTQEPEHETFHILTEPEHITAVMSEKDRDQTSMDLISVISIAGGVMMTVITVAIIIVMIERCKRPRYDEVRKMNDIRMQVMIDNSDVPPPYVRSIFHAPLPDPPHSDRCHYQPISTLDRNLKQFMRPVVVQSISPVMLENFRGILECHYDHLPRRNHDFGTMPARGPVSTKPEERRPLSVADYTIEALKCEAKLDVIDNTTSEPLYAEIPCWRPPSEHAIAVVNLNGEAITEL